MSMVSVCFKRKSDFLCDGLGMLHFAPIFLHLHSLRNPLVCRKKRLGLFYGCHFPSVYD